MTHRELRARLADYARGHLQAETRAEVATHLGTCAACREWLQTYDLLARAQRAQMALDHPDAASLADWAVRGDLPEEGAAHIAACASCRRELELLNAALAAARGEPRGERPGTRRRPERRRIAAWAAAAVLAFAVLAGALLLGRRADSSGERLVAGGRLAGEEMIAARSIYALDVEVSSGSNIVFAAGDTIRLGEGFVVASGATFAAGAAGSADN